MSTREAPQRSNRSKIRVESERVETETTLRRLQARGERLLRWFPEIRNTWQRDGEPGLESLLTHLQTLGGQVSRRAQETGRDLEARAERVLADLERQAMRGLGPILSRANLASGRELSNLELRLAQLEERLEPLLESRTQLTSQLANVQRALDDARADATERLREMTVLISANDELRNDLGRVHDHLDTLSKEQVTRSLEIGKLHDRLVRVEIRMGDVLKEQGAQLTAHQDMARKITELDQSFAESTRSVQSVREQAESATAEGRATDARLTAFMSARSADHDELARLADLLGSVQQTLRQVDLRLGDLGERYAGVREELADLSARVSHLELAPTRPISATILTGRTEGH
jgi:DNA repair exonuclease SbcCD ATPase subunit